MAYMGRKGAAAPLTSADIPDGSITTAKIVDDNVTAAKIPAGAVSSDVVYLENNASTQDLSGTYSTERLYFNDSYQLTGDVTVTGHLALGTIADADVVITQDSTERTITGSGTLESGELLSSKETDLTGMTGELGSVVTGSPNLNLTTGTLGSGVTFPAGHIIQTQFTQYEGFAHMTGMGSHQNVPLIIINGSAATSLGTTGILQVAITPKSNSKIKLECQWMGEYNGDNLHDSMWCLVRSKGSTHIRLDNSTSSNSSTTNGFRGIQVPFRTYHSSHVGSTPEGMSFTYFDNAHTGDGTDRIIYKLAIVSATSSITDIYTNRNQDSGYYNHEMGISLISATELAG